MYYYLSILATHHRKIQKNGAYSKKTLMIILLPIPVAVAF